VPGQAAAGCVERLPLVAMAALLVLTELLELIEPDPDWIWPDVLISVELTLACI
jgi:hypothetical protein